jgi:cytidylate kinase
MWKNIDLQKCLSHIQNELGVKESDPPEMRPSITISRMCGAGGRTVASKLVDFLQPHAPFGCHWTIYDKKLIEKVLEDHLLSTRLAEYVPESSKSLLSELMGRMRGNRPHTNEIIEQTIETIWKLAEGGHVILVGRAANVITAGLKNVFHVRLVGSLEQRIERVEEVYEMGRAEAEAYIKSQDAGKKLYMKEYFGREIDDPQLYHVVVNTDRIPYEFAARLIADTFLNWRKSELAAKAA